MSSYPQNMKPVNDCSNCKIVTMLLKNIRELEEMKKLRDEMEEIKRKELRFALLSRQFCLN
jgi:hypothetical protein